MAAPRRVGKTSIMYNLRDVSRKGYTFIYIPTEAVDSSELYFQRLFEALLDNEEVSKKIKASEKARTIFGAILDRVKKIKTFGVELELNQKGKEKYAAVNAVIESLEYDGYINLRNNSYTFNSPILQLWWNKYVR